jgi:hypothetical protein
MGGVRHWRALGLRRSVARRRIPPRRRRHLGRAMRVWGGNVLACLSYALLACRVASAQDTVTVHADGPPPWGKSTRLVEELRIGRLSGSEHETFGNLIAAAVGPSGEIVVVDQQGPALRLFDSAGRYVRDLGRPGQGPGEYIQISGVHFTPAGQVAIWDPANARISVFAEDGTVINTIRMTSGMRAAGQAFQVDTAGDFYVLAARSFVRYVVSQYAWLKVDPLGNVVDSLPVPRPNRVGRPLILWTPGGPLEPFTVETVSALSPYGYQVVGRTDRYAVWRRLLDGGVLRIERGGRRLPVSRQEREEWEAVEDYFRVRDRPGAKEFDPIPSRKPFFRRLWVDESGRVWVSRYVAAVHVARSRQEKEEDRGALSLDWVEPPVWDVLDKGGELLGTVTLPRNTLVVAARGLMVWAIAHGRLDESYLVRYRIVNGD